jgi:hypothetical protein
MLNAESIRICRSNDEFEQQMAKYSRLNGISTQSPKFILFKMNISQELEHILQALFA